MPAGEGVVRTVSLSDELALAIATRRLSGVGRDLVHRAVNAVVAEGARPIGITCQYLGAQHTEAIVGPIAEAAGAACAELGVALSALSLAKSSGGSYLVAAILGAKQAMPRPKAGDRLVALGGLGLHSCGFGYARAVVFGRMGLGMADDLPGTGGTVAESLLEVRRCFGPLVLECVDRGVVAGLISLEETPLRPAIAAWLQPGMSAQVDLSSWCLPPLAELLSKASGRSAVEAADDLNLGVGLIAVTGDPDAVVRLADARGIPARSIGILKAGDRSVSIEPTQK
jgi:phosphoribosylformylglycinamidine cyclo-ligase